MDRASKLFTMMIADEGLRRTAYDDATGVELKATGNVTIGIGHNLDANPLSIAIIKAILLEDVDTAIDDAKAVLGEALWSELSENRQLAFINLTFNMGRGGLAEFRKMLAAVSVSDWQTAALELRDSLWAKQVQAGRVERVVRLIELDEFTY